MTPDTLQTLAARATAYPQRLNQECAKLAKLAKTYIDAFSAATANIADAAVTKAKLSASLSPSHVVKYAGTFTTVNGSATQTITVSGVASSDIVHVNLRVAGASPQTILTAVPTTNTITVVMSANPAADHVLQYSVLRAAT